MLQRGEQHGDARKADAKVENIHARDKKCDKVMEAAAHPPSSVGVISLADHFIPFLLNQQNVSNFCFVIKKLTIRQRHLNFPVKVQTSAESVKMKSSRCYFTTNRLFSATNFQVHFGPDNRSRALKVTEKVQTLVAVLAVLTFWILLAKVHSWCYSTLISKCFKRVTRSSTRKNWKNIFNHISESGKKRGG